jgi:hypothetical protein
MPKILLLDIETAPNKVYMWDMYQEWNSSEMLIESWYILCWCAKWLDNKKVMSSALVDFPKKYTRSKRDERAILLAMHALLSEADIIVGHNISGFDLGKLKAKFLQYNITLPPPVKMVDTLLAARKGFKFTSNKLGDLATFLGIGHKVDTGGFKLWKGCMAGEAEAWEKMVEYCKQDVLLLEEVYLKLRADMQGHPNLGAYLSGEGPVCPKCGSFEMVKHGFTFSNQTKYQRYQCQQCGGYARSRTGELAKGHVQVVNIT